MQTHDKPVICGQEKKKEKKKKEQTTPMLPAAWIVVLLRFWVGQVYVQD